MAIVRLTTVWINALDDQGKWSDSLKVASASGLEQSEESNMRARDATGNRRRITILPGGGGDWRLSCQLSCIEELMWLRKHRAQMLCFRDMHGEKIFGVYPKVIRNPFNNRVHFGVSVSITQIDHSEEV